MSLADALGRGGRYTVDTAYAAGVAGVVNTNAARAAQDEPQAAPSNYLANADTLTTRTGQRQVTAPP